MKKNVQIPYELFADILKYHLLELDGFEEKIKKGLEQKLDALVNQDLYKKYKTAPTEEEREAARKDYLDRKGVPESFRW